MQTQVTQIMIRLIWVIYDIKAFQIYKKYFQCRKKRLELFDFVLIRVNEASEQTYNSRIMANLRP